MSHTPGPWTVLDHTKEPPTQEILCIPETGFALECEPFESISDTDRANAHLIAAAPDLLEALESMLGAVETMTCPQNIDDAAMLVIRFASRIDQSRAAIKKARGEQ